MLRTYEALALFLAERGSPSEDTETTTERDNTGCPLWLATGQESTEGISEPLTRFKGD